MLLSDRDIRAEIESGRVKVDPYGPELIQPSSVDVRLDRYFRVFENHRYPHIDPAVEQPDLTRLVETADDEPFVLHPGEFVLASTYEVVSLPDDLAGRLEGKALAIDTPIPSPGGWRAMGDLREGDQVFDEMGNPTTVIAVTGITYDRACREVRFSDGQAIVADLAHQWLTRTKTERKHGGQGTVRTTREIEESLRAGDEWNHHVALAGIYRQRLFRILCRASEGNVMVPLIACAKRFLDLARRADRALPPCLRSVFVRVSHWCARSATIAWPSENTHLPARPVIHDAGDGDDRRRVAHSSKTWSPARRSPIVRQPPGPGIGVSIARALPSRRPARSSGSETTS